MWSWRNAFWRMHYTHVLWLSGFTCGYFQSSSNLLEAIHGIYARTYKWLIGRMISLDRVPAIVNVQDCGLAVKRLQTVTEMDLQNLPHWIRREHDSALIARLYAQYREIVNLIPIRSSIMDNVTGEGVWPLTHYQDGPNMNQIDWKECVTKTAKKRSADLHKLTEFLCDYVENLQSPLAVSLDQHLKSQQTVLKKWARALGDRLTVSEILMQVRKYWTETDEPTEENLDDGDNECVIDGRPTQSEHMLSLYTGCDFYTLCNYIFVVV